MATEEDPLSKGKPKAGPKSKAKSSKKLIKESNSYETELAEIEKKSESVLEKIEEIRGRRCYVLWTGINNQTVDAVYDDLRTNYIDSNGKLDVVIDSGGGSIDAAYNLACLFQQYGSDELTFIIPRWAKSAATLLACSGEEILMTPVAELGPLIHRLQL